MCCIFWHLWAASDSLPCPETCSVWDKMQCEEPLAMVSSGSTMSPPRVGQDGSRESDKTLQTGMVQITWVALKRWPMLERYTAVVKYFTVDKIFHMRSLLWSLGISMEKSQRSTPGCLWGISWTPRAPFETLLVVYMSSKVSAKEGCLPSPMRRIEFGHTLSLKINQKGMHTSLKRLRRQNIQWTGDSSYMICKRSLL